MTHEDALDTSAVPRLGLSLGSILAIGLGGALGTLARYLLGATLTTAPGHFPATTLLINLSGSLAIGFLVPLTDTVSARFALTRPFLVVGFLGDGRPTPPWRWRPCSSAGAHHVGLAAAYLAASLVGGLAAGDTGRRGRPKGCPPMITTVAHSPTLGLALLVALAGGVGAVARALLIHHISVRRSDPLPIGTVVVNASGSLLLGFLTGLSIYHGLAPRFLSVVGVGLCGGYTTFSTASWESLHLIRTGPAANGDRLHLRRTGAPVWVGPSPAWPWPRSSEVTSSYGRVTSGRALIERARL